MACYTQQEIAEEIGIHKDTVSEIVEVCQKKYPDTKSDKLAKYQDSDFELPIYNIWNGI